MIASTCALGELMAPRTGSVDPFKFTEEVFDLYSIPAFDKGEPEILAGSAIGSTKQVVEPGDVLLSKIVPHIRRAWVVGSNRGRRIIASGEWIVFRSSRAHPAYLRHLLVSDAFHARFMQTVSGVGGSLLRARPSHVAKIEVALPSHEEQLRTAELLDRAEALRGKRRAAFVLLDDLQQSIFVDLIGDPSTNPKHWPLGRVSDFVSAFQGGKSLEAESGDDVVTPYRVLKISAVTSMTFRPEESKPVPASYSPPQDHVLRHGDLLFSRANTSELVGAVAYVDQAPPNLLLPDKLWRFVWRETAQVEPLFIWALFQTAAVRREIARRATGTSGSMKNISQEKLFGIPVIMPPVDIQREFARLLQTVQHLKTRYLASANAVDALFAALQHRAFCAEL